MHRTRLRMGMAFVVGSLAFAGVLEVACSEFTAPPDAPETGTDASATADVNASDASNPCAVGTCRIVFVTSVPLKGNFGGLDKGDEECAKLASASSHPAVKGRSFRAWLSGKDAGAIDRHVTEEKRYVRVDGVTVASGWTQLTSVFQEAGALQAPILIDENGVSAGEAIVWTGTTYQGIPSDNTCDGWTSPTPAVGQTGRADRTDEAWTDTDVALQAARNCSLMARLYCFEK